MTFITWLYSCPWKLQRAILHIIYILNWKNILWKWNACMDDLELFDNVDKTKIHTCFRSLAFTTAQLTMWKALPQPRVPTLCSPHAALFQCTMTVLPTLGWFLIPSSKRWQQHPCLWEATPVRDCPWKGRRTDTQGKSKCTPTRPDKLSISELSTSFSRPSTVDMHNIRHRTMYKKKNNKTNF